MVHVHVHVCEFQNKMTNRGINIYIQCIIILNKKSQGQDMKQIVKYILLSSLLFYSKNKIIT